MIQVRIPVVPRFNDSVDDLHAMGRFVAELGAAVTLVQLLPYHAMGVPKWERIKCDGPILEATAPSDKRMGEVKAILEEYDLDRAGALTSGRDDDRQKEALRCTSSPPSRHE